MTAAADSAVRAVLALHADDGYGFCDHCTEVSGDIAIPWPCDTVVTVRGCYAP